MCVRGSLQGLNQPGGGAHGTGANDVDLPHPEPGENTERAVRKQVSTTNLIKRHHVETTFDIVLGNIQYICLECQRLGTVTKLKAGKKRRER